MSTPPPRRRRQGVGVLTGFLAVLAFGIATSSVGWLMAERHAMFHLVNDIVLTPTSILSSTISSSSTIPLTHSSFPATDAVASLATTINTTTEDGGYPLPQVNVASLPTWMQDYLTWHARVRRQYGDRLFTASNRDDNIPKVLIKTCSRSERCGGLNDRLGKLVWDLYLANQTQRVLFYNWCKPFSLEEFLVPNNHKHQGTDLDVLDFSIPASQTQFFGDLCTPTVNRVPNLFQGTSAARPLKGFWDREFGMALERARGKGEYAVHRILKFKLLGGDKEWRRLSQRYPDASGATVASLDYLGHLFWLWFKPSPALQLALDAVYRQHQLQPYQYAAVHCRVRHPKATSVKVKAKPNRKGAPDQVGLHWEGESREFAIATATRAVRCLLPKLEQRQQQDSGPMPVYFYSDSEDLVHFMTHNASSPSTRPAEDAAHQVAQKVPIFSRPTTSETLHLDRQAGQQASDFYDTFVDLLVAARAACASIGIGNYGLLASKLSLAAANDDTSSCLVQYAQEVWGEHQGKAELCTIPE